MRGLLRAAAAWVPDGTPLPILSGPLRGAWWHAGAAPGPSKGLSVNLNRSEPAQLAEAWRLVRKGSVCFDVGAHAGLYTLLLSRKARRVYAFEPLPANLAALHRTLARNRVANAVTVPFALAGRTGLMSFREGEHSSEGRLDPDGAVPVMGVTCADFISRYGESPDLLKIDVEGAELDLLRGSLDFFRARRPDLLLSTHGEGIKSECLRLLRDIGYAGIRPLDAAGETEAREFSATAADGPSA